MKIVNAILSPTLALLVLISSISFTIERHLCMGKVHSVAILHDAAPCAMESFAKSENPLPMDGCCQEDHLVIQGNDYPANNVKVITLVQQGLWIASLPRVINTIDFSHRVSQLLIPYYKPPLIEREIPIFIQSFLI